MTKTVRVLITQDADGFSAQCLEYDIGAQGNSLRQVQERFSTVFVSTFEESLRRTGVEFGGIYPAPHVYHDQWAATERQNLSPIEFETEGAVVSAEVVLLAA